MTNPSPQSVLKKYPSGNIFQLFGENPEDYIKPAVGGYAGHPGIDLTAYEGAPLVAVCDSWVSRIEENPKRLGGLAIQIVSKDGQKMYGYGHLKKILVSLGQELKEGQQIGTMGNTGFVVSNAVEYWGNAPAGKGVHCHFSKMFVKMNGKTPQILNWDNGYKGFVDPLPDLVSGSIKAEIPDERIPLLIQLVGLYRSLIKILGGKPVA